MAVAAAVRRSRDRTTTAVDAAVRVGGCVGGPDHFRGAHCRFHAAGRDRHRRGADCRCASAPVTGLAEEIVDSTVPLIEEEIVEVIQPLINEHIVSATDRRNNRGGASASGAHPRAQCGADTGIHNVSDQRENS